MSDCCGNIKDKIELLQKTAQALHQGHMGVSAIYTEFASNEAKDEKELSEFLAEARKHATMAADSLEVVVPDSYQVTP